MSEPTKGRVRSLWLAPLCLLGLLAVMSFHDWLVVIAFWTVFLLADFAWRRWLLRKVKP